MTEQATRKPNTAGGDHITHHAWRLIERQRTSGGAGGSRLTTVPLRACDAGCSPLPRRLITHLQRRMKGPDAEGSTGHEGHAARGNLENRRAQGEKKTVAPPLLLFSCRVHRWALWPDGLSHPLRNTARPLTCRRALRDHCSLQPSFRSPCDDELRCCCCDTCASRRIICSRRRRRRVRFPQEGRS